MHITHLSLPTHDLTQQKYFYEGVLKLPLVAEIGKEITFQVGSSRLTFYQADHQGCFHFAFDIPHNQFATAKAWMSKRLQLVTDAGGKDEFRGQAWDIHHLYFYDPAGNIAELVARHTLDNASDAPFSPQSWLNISEMGIATDDVRGLVGRLSSTMQVQPYHDDGVDTNFCAVGDAHGLLIVVKAGRKWYPDALHPADFLPFKLEVVNEAGQTFTISAPPYGVIIEEGTS